MTFHFWSWHSCHSFRSELHASNDRTMAPVIHPISNINIINGEYIKIAPTSSNVDISCMQTIDIIAIAQRVTSTCGFVVFHMFFFFFALFLPDPHQWLPCTLLFYVSNFFFFFLFSLHLVCARGTHELAIGVIVLTHTQLSSAQQLWKTFFTFV